MYCALLYCNQPQHVLDNQTALSRFTPLAQPSYSHHYNARITLDQRNNLPLILPIGINHPGASRIFSNPPINPPINLAYAVPSTCHQQSISPWNPVVSVVILQFQFSLTLAKPSIFFTHAYLPKQYRFCDSRLTAVALRTVRPWGLLKCRTSRTNCKPTFFLKVRFSRPPACYAASKKSWTGEYTLLLRRCLSLPVTPIFALPLSICEDDLHGRGGFSTARLQLS
jgi:hypothetical protein